MGQGPVPSPPWSVDCPVPTVDSRAVRYSVRTLSELPRVLLCTFDVLPGPTGSSRRLTEYLKALEGRFQAVVISTKTPDHSHIERFLGARLLRVPVGGGDLGSKLLAFERAVRRQLESEEYALAHFTDPFGGFPLCERRDELGYRLLYEAHGFPSQELRYTYPRTEGDPRFLSRVRRQELFCLMNADLVVTGSPTTARFIRELGVSEEQIQVLRAPVDLTSYAPAAMGLPDATPMRVLYLGNQAGYQGLPTLLRAVQHACQRAELHLSVVGPQGIEGQPRLEDLLEELKLRGKVEIQPPLPASELPKALAACDVGVLPLEALERNRLQGGPLAKASEYLAAGRPVVAADLPLTRQMLPESATVFFPPGDFVRLGEALVELAGQPRRRVELGENARAAAAKHLDASLIQGRLLEIYRKLVHGAPMSADAPGEGRPETGTPTGNAIALLSREGPKTDPAIAPSRARSRGQKADLEDTDPGEGKALPAATEQAEREEPLEVGSEDILEGEGAVSSAPESRLDPWFAQLAHGYCPPEGAQLARPPPPPIAATPGAPNPLPEGAVER